jgi:protein-tyrosine phosphatase
MAEYVFRDMVNKKGWGECFEVASAATSTEEIGNPVHHGTRAILKQHGITTEGKRAVQIRKSDYAVNDYIVAMDQRNVQNILRITGSDSKNKIHRILEYTGENRDVADPWYTDDFETTFTDVYRGCEALLDRICMDHLIT